MKEILDLLPEEERRRFSILSRSEVPKFLWDEFISYLRSNWAGNRYIVLQFPWTIAPEGYYDKEMLDFQFSILSKEEILFEFWATWVSDSDGPFKASMLERATDPTLMAEHRGRSYTYVMGVDPASQSSEFGLVLVKIVGDEGQSAHVVHAKGLRNLELPDQVRLIYSYLNDFNVSLIYMDPDGGGYALAAALSEPNDPFDCWGDFGRPVIQIEDDESKEGAKILRLQKMTNPWVTRMNNMMISDMQRGRMVFAGASRPDDPSEEILDEIEKLKREMIRLRRYVAGDSIKYDLPGDPGDPQHQHDRWSALTLAYGAYLEMRERMMQESQMRSYNLIGIGEWL